MITFFQFPFRLFGFFHEVFFKTLWPWMHCDRWERGIQFDVKTHIGKKRMRKCRKMCPQHCRWLPHKQGSIKIYFIESVHQNSVLIFPNGFYKKNKITDKHFVFCYQSETEKRLILWKDVCARCVKVSLIGLSDICVWFCRCVFGVFFLNASHIYNFGSLEMRVNRCYTSRKINADDKVL